jgi:hypothetical protein
MQFGARSRDGLLSLHLLFSTSENFFLVGVGHEGSDEAWLG